MQDKAALDIANATKENVIKEILSTKLAAVP
jgi:hypothetical protein